MPSRCGPPGHDGQSGDLPVPAQRVYAHAKALRPCRVRRRLAVAPPFVWPSTRPPVSALWMNRFRGAIPRLRAPLPTSRLPPHGDLRTARGRCGSLDLHRSGLSPPAPCQSPGKSGRSVTAAWCARLFYPANSSSSAFASWRWATSKARCNEAEASAFRLSPTFLLLLQEGVGLGQHLEAISLLVHLVAYFLRCLTPECVDRVRTTWTRDRLPAIVSC
jgi:hypothetical protein